MADKRGSVAVISGPRAARPHPPRALRAPFGSRNAAPADEEGRQAPTSGGQARLRRPSTSQAATISPAAAISASQSGNSAVTRNSSV